MGSRSDWEDFSGGSVIKNLLALQETQVQSLGQKDPLEKKIVTYSSILVWEISWVARQATVHGVANSNTWLSN